MYANVAGPWVFVCDRGHYFIKDRHENVLQDDEPFAPNPRTVKCFARKLTNYYSSFNMLIKCELISKQQ